MAVTEYHNIEAICMAALVKDGCIDLGDLTKLCQQKLGNPHIYKELVKERVKALIRRNWVRDVGYCYKITPKGFRAAARMLATRHQP